MSPIARVVAVIAVVVGAACAALGAPPEKLELRDLINRPDRLPARVTLGRDFDFGGGEKAVKGQVVGVIEFNGAEVGVDAGNGLYFGIAPGDCDLLEAANAAWATLTPEQRAVEPATLVNDPSIWPATVRTAGAIRLQDGKELPAGTEFDLVTITAEGAQIASAEHDANFMTNLPETDVLARARELVLLKPEERPSRIAAALRKWVVDAEGKRIESNELDKASVYVLYFTASWCAPCRAFSPSLVKYVGEAAPANPRLRVVLISQDEEDAKLRAYMRESKMLWPAVPLAGLRKSHVLSAYAGRSIPQLVVVDRHGKVLADSFVPGRYIPPQTVLKNLQALVESGAAR